MPKRPKAAALKLDFFLPEIRLAAHPYLRHSTCVELFLSICLGIGLSAACGFRVFVPLLVVSIASRGGHLHLSPGFEWMGSDAALIASA